MPYTPPSDDYSTEVVTRCAPRWAWEVLDETLLLDANSKSFTPDLRDEISAAVDAMVEATERGD